SEGVELLLVAEEPGCATQDVFRVDRVVLDVREHGIGGQQPRGMMQCPHGDRLAVWPHRADEGPTGIAARGVRLPVLIDLIGTAEVHVTTVLLTRRPSVGGGFDDLDLSGVYGTAVERVPHLVDRVVADRR